MSKTACRQVHARARVPVCPPLRACLPACQSSRGCLPATVPSGSARARHVRHLRCFKKGRTTKSYTLRDPTARPGRSVAGLQLLARWRRGQCLDPAAAAVFGQAFAPFCERSRGRPRVSPRLLRPNEPVAGRAAGRAGRAWSSSQKRTHAAPPGAAAAAAAMAGREPRYLDAAPWSGPTETTTREA